MTISYKGMLVPTARAQIHWLTDTPAVATFWRPEPDAPTHCIGWQMIMIGVGDGDYCDGACCTDWCTPRHMPEHTFVGILARFHRPDPETARAFHWELVRQFARIEGCSWARRMYEQRENRELTRDDLAPYAIMPNGLWVELPMGPFVAATAA